MNTISAGFGFTVAITNYGRINGWGSDVYDNASGHEQITLDVDEVYVAVSTGGYHTMALTSQGRIVGWGTNWFGQVSGKKDPDHRVITKIAYHNIDQHKYVAVSAGYSYTSAITTEGKIVEWGLNQQLHAIELEDINDIQLNENESYISISSGHQHAMAVTSEGRIVGWGSNDYDKITGHENINLNSGEKYIDVNASSNLFTIALTSEGRIFGWGKDADDILQNIQNLEFNPYEPYVGISTSYYTVMALTSKGRIVGWGNDQYGQVSGIQKLSPGVKYIAVSAGIDHTIAKTSDGKIVGWGKDRHGEVSGWESIELGPGENYKKFNIDMAVVRKKKEANPRMQYLWERRVIHPTAGIYGPVKSIIEDTDPDSVVLFGDYYMWRDWCKKLDKQFKIDELKTIGENLKIKGYDTMTKKELCKNNRYYGYSNYKRIIYFS